MDMWNKGFEGWYYKHQLGADAVAFIPGRAKSGSFVQMISTEGSRYFAVPELWAEKGVIHGGNCLFSSRGCRIDLPGVSGEIFYGKLTALNSDIMGPFRFLPMECRHGVISMYHKLKGSLVIDGKRHSFDGGIGYIEKDSGKSFPSSYQWLQCNDFGEPCSLMVSIANIPFCGGNFTGCICSIIYGGREYRLATYKGVRILAADENHIRLFQGKLLLELDITPLCPGKSLYAPVKGQMTGIIRESVSAGIRARLWDRSRQVFDLRSSYAAYEFAPSVAGQQRDIWEDKGLKQSFIL